MLQFLKKLKRTKIKCIKLVPRHYIKYSYQHLSVTICIHYLSFLSFICNHLQKYFLQLEHHNLLICKVNDMATFLGNVPGCYM